MNKISEIVKKAGRAPKYYYRKHSLKKERTLLKSGQWTYTTRGPKDMFFLQVRDNLFCRPDVSVRYLAIENYYGKNDFGFELYSKLQDIRQYKGYSQEAVEGFRKLINSYETDGYNPESFIIADKKLHLRDGAHRLALALYFDMPEVTTAIYDSETFGNFTYQWYLDRGFTKEEIDVVHNKSELLREQLNTPIHCIVWDKAETQKVKAVMEQIGTVCSCEEIHIDKEIFEDFKSSISDLPEQNADGITFSSDDISVISVKLNAPDYLPVKFLQPPVFTQFKKAQTALAKFYGKNKWQSVATVSSSFYCSDIIKNSILNK